MFEGCKRFVELVDSPDKLKAVLAFKKEGRKHSEKNLRSGNAAAAAGSSDHAGEDDRHGGEKEADPLKHVPDFLKRSMSSVSFEGAALMARFAKTRGV